MSHHLLDKKIAEVISMEQEGYARVITYRDGQECQLFVHDRSYGQAKISRVFVAREDLRQFALDILEGLK